MKTKLSYLFLVAISFSCLLFSCNTEELNLADTESSGTNEDATTAFVFKYKDKTYNTSIVSTKGGSDITDDEARKEYYRLMNTPDIAILINTDGSLHFFDNGDCLMEEVDEQIQISQAQKDDISTKTDDVTTKALPEIFFAKATLYDDDNYRDRQTVLTIDQSLSQRFDIPSLKSYNSFNDKCTSISMHYRAGASNMAVLILYENDTYNQNDRGYAFYAITYQNKPSYLHADLKRLLKEIPWGFGTKADSWNDRISSCKFYITGLGNHPVKDGNIRNPDLP